MFRLAIALMLLSQSDPQPKAVIAFASEISAILIHAEIMDKRETTYYFLRENEVQFDWAVMQKRAKELVNAPYINEHFLFMCSRAEAGEVLLENRKYFMYIDKAMQIHRNSDILKSAKEDTDLLYTVWGNIRDAKCEMYVVHVRRLSLMKVKEIIGDEAYYAGRMPPHVPRWYFSELR